MSIPNPAGTASSVFVRVPSIVGETLVQAMVDNTYNFNQSVIKVESIDVELLWVDWEIANGKVLFHGKLRKHVYYVTGSHYVKEKREDISFSNFAVIPGATPDMRASVTVKIHGIEWDLEQHCRLEQHILLDISVQVTQSIEFNIPIFGQITGQVLLGGVAQANAIIALYDPNGVLIAYTFTNSNGYYKLINVPAGSYTIVAAVTGTYESRTILVGMDSTAPLVVNFFQSPTTTCTNILSASTCAFLNGLLGVV